MSQLIIVDIHTYRRVQIRYKCGHMAPSNVIWHKCNANQRVSVCVHKSSSISINSPMHFGTTFYVKRNALFTYLSAVVVIWVWVTHSVRAHQNLIWCNGTLVIISHAILCTWLDARIVDMKHIRGGGGSGVSPSISKLNEFASIQFTGAVAIVSRIRAHQFCWPVRWCWWWRPLISTSWYLCVRSVCPI